MRFYIHFIINLHKEVPTKLVASVASVSNWVIARQSFFCCLPNFLDELARKRLLRRLSSRMAKCEIPRFDENIWTIFPFPSVEFWLIHRLKILKKKPMPPNLSQNLANCFINWRILETFLVQSRMWTSTRFSCILQKYTAWKTSYYYILLCFLVCLFLYQKKITLLFLLKVKPSPDRKMIKLLLFYNLITCFRHWLRQPLLLPSYGSTSYTTVARHLRTLTKNTTVLSKRW